MTSRRKGIAGVAALIVLLACGFVVWSTIGDDTEQAEAAPSTTSTTTSSSTTSTTTTSLPPVVVDPTVTTIATSVAPLIGVFAQPPTEAVLDDRASAAGASLAALVPATSPERVDAPAIPTLQAPVVGRRSTETGWEFDNPTPWGNPLTFVVTENHGEWLRVEMPVRPNGTEGWIRASDVTQSTITTHVEIDLSDRTLKAWDGAILLAETPVVIGKDQTPTPLGRLYVTDYEEKYSGSAYGPWILPLSGYSQQLDEFSGGVPVIAMHGTNRPELVGTAASNGCIRMPDAVIEILRARLPIGTPVDTRG